MSSQQRQSTCEQAGTQQHALWHENWLLEFDSQCPICLAAVICSPALVPCCGAIFCETCLQQWLDPAAGRNSCPLCKATVPEYVTIVNIPPLLFQSVHVASALRQWSLPRSAWRRLVYSLQARPQPPLPQRQVPQGVFQHKSAAPLRRWVRRDLDALSGGDVNGALGDMAVALLGTHGSGDSGRAALHSLLPPSTASQLCDELEMWTAALPAAASRDQHDEELKRRYVFSVPPPGTRTLPHDAPSLPRVEADSESLQQLLSSVLQQRRTRGQAASAVLQRPPLAPHMHAPTGTVGAATSAKQSTAGPHAAISVEGTTEADDDHSSSRMRRRGGRGGVAAGAASTAVPSHLRAADEAAASAGNERRVQAGEHGFLRVTISGARQGGRKRCREGGCSSAGDADA